MKERKQMKQQIKTWWPAILVFAVLLGLSGYLLNSDVWTFLTWWMLAFLMGMIAMPVTGRLFVHFDDRGWLFSKVLAIAAGGFIEWFLVSIKLLSFTRLTCVLVCLVLAAVCVLLFWQQQKNKIECFPVEHMKLVCWEEILFFGVFLMWTYLAGFHPQAYGTEKFMDYGFMEAMMRSTTLPATDLWYSQGTINYYYGGQYFAVFLTKLAGSQVEITYNLMRTFVAGFAFVLPFSLVYQLTKDRLSGRKEKRAWAAPVSGILGGLAVSIAGNMHYVIYGQIIPMIQKLTGAETIDSYWFPDATRYIGYNPDVADKTIHEFPCYSFVLGDLHAHVVNVMFVIFLLGVLYAWMQWVRQRQTEEVSGKAFWLRELTMPHILLVSVLLGMFQWTNYWDYVIYFVVTGGVVLFANIIRFEGKVSRILAVTAAQAVEVIAISTLVIVPFTIQFDTMVQGVALAQNHSLFYQLLILWGLPTILVILFLISVLWEKLRSKENRSLYRLLRSITVPDLYVVILGLCAMGLVLIPELVYVRDIYENGNARANTMFKLTYQAYIMFGIAMGYVIFRLILVSRQKILKVLAGIGLFFLIWTLGYFGNSVSAWFGQVSDPSQYQGLNALNFLESDFAEDASAIHWLKENIQGSPVVLEANGDSYTGYERVSASTGLPTILGWYVHEWLWRNDVADLNQKSADVESIYTSSDVTEVQRLLSQYDVSYIFVGSMEREKYGDLLNESLLQSLGEIVYQDPVYDTYIIKLY
jgi:uncharacterized membrane protein